MSAEHGCFLRAPGAKNWISLTDDLDMDWKRDVLQIFRCEPFFSSVGREGCVERVTDWCFWCGADYEARTQGAFVEKKVSSVTFHYRNADPVFGLFQGESSSPAVSSL
jgi:trehalose 6-phosphate synthase/phosphatase